MNRNQKIILTGVLLFGLVVPFVPLLAVIEMFFLLLPFAVITAAALIWWIVSLLIKGMDSRKALFAFLIIPTFILAQLLAGFSVDKLQRYRSRLIIAELEQIHNETGALPERYDLVAGIKYTRMRNQKHFLIEYSRGFMVTEKYYSETGNWKSYGWND